MLTQASVVGRDRDRHDLRDRDQRHRPLGRLDARGRRTSSAESWRSPSSSTVLFILAAVGFATFLGTINATSIAYGRVVPFIATLAMFSIGKGVALLLNDKQPVGLLDFNGGSFGDPAPFSLLWFGTGRIARDPGVGLSSSSRSRSAAGSCSTGLATAGSSSPSAATARRRGSPASRSGRSIFSVYVLSGLLVGIATVLLCARLGSASPVSGNLYELDAIGAVVIGGTSLAGGQGDDRRDLPRGAHVRPDLQLDDAAESLNGDPAGGQGRDRARRGPAPTTGGAALNRGRKFTIRSRNRGPHVPTPHEERSSHVAQATHNPASAMTSLRSRCRSPWPHAVAR